MKLFTFSGVMFAVLLMSSEVQHAECPVSTEKTVSEITYEVWFAYGRPTGGLFAVFYNFPYNLIDIISEVILNDELPYIGSLSDFVWNSAVKVQQDILNKLTSFWESKFCHNKEVFEWIVFSYWILISIVAVFFYEAGCAQSVFLLTPQPEISKRKSKT